ncbi:MAG: hypothetical protein ACLP1X_05530 [Polyangiaceae bacterium]
MIRVTHAPWAFSLAASFVAVLGSAGCNSTSTATSYTPITGIEILPSSLLQGLQCGMGVDEVYRYVVVVWRDEEGGPLEQPIASNVFDCFTTGLFENLPASDGGSEEFFLRIFAYNYGSLPPSFACPGALSADGGVCSAQTDASLVEAGSATWTTTCTATQQQGIPVLAVCAPLVPLQPDGGVAAE